MAASASPHLREVKISVSLARTEGGVRVMQGPQARVDVMDPALGLEGGALELEEPVDVGLPGDRPERRQLV